MDTMDTFIWIYNLPVEVMIFLFNLGFWYAVLYGTYKAFERLWDGR